MRGGVKIAENRFLLTHLLRGVTEFNRETVESLLISTHTPLARCDA